MDILVDFMERHQEFARDYSMNSPELWQVLVTLLSSAEGVTQSEKSWKKVKSYADLLIFLFILDPLIFTFNYIFNLNTAPIIAAPNNPLFF